MCRTGSISMSAKTASDRACALLPGKSKTLSNLREIVLDLATRDLEVFAEYFVAFADSSRYRVRVALMKDSPIMLQWQVPDKGIHPVSGCVVGAHDVKPVLQVRRPFATVERLVEH